MQKFFHIGFLVLAILAVSGCSPFGNQSLIEDIASEVAIFIPGRMSTSVNSGASTTVTAGGYLVTHSVGDTFQLSSPNAVDATSATTGYRVYSSVSTETQ